MGKMKNGATVLVCGSKAFEDRALVFGLLSSLKEQLTIETIVSGDFTGASKFAKEWADENNINYKTHNFFSDKNDKKTTSFYDTSVLPVEVLSYDKAFVNAKEELISEGVDMLMSFPNKSFDLGVATKNLTALAQLAGIPALDGAEAYKNILQHQEEVKEASIATETTTHRKTLSGLKHI